MNWQDDTVWERDWWGNCVNTLNGELVQFSFAKRMGLEIFQSDRSPYNIDMKGRSVLDIGGGPVSLLLKCVNLSEGRVVDPCEYPAWVVARYEAANIQYHKYLAEDIPTDWRIDEVWIYNVLQHVMDPVKIVSTARTIAKTIRVFEWIDTGVAIGHPHNLTEAGLNNWLGSSGTVEKFCEHGNTGQPCYWGVFSGRKE